MAIFSQFLEGCLFFIENSRSDKWREKAKLIYERFIFHIRANQQENIVPRKAELKSNKMRTSIFIAQADDQCFLSYS